MNLKYLSLEEILRLHFQVIQDFGGSHGVRDENRLNSVVGAPKQVAFGQEQYVSLFEKAAVYLRNIIGDHPFSDGNKRTALVVCGIFLARNSHPTAASPKELEDFTVQIAADHLSISDIATWLESHSQQG
jgi:death-on-curing protein